MKLTFLLLFAITIGAYAEGMAQQVNISVKNASLERVLSEISKQTKLRFLYKEELMNNTAPITVNLNNVEVKEALNKVLAKQNLNYRIIARTVTLSKSKNAPLSIQQPATIQVSGIVTDSIGPIAGVSVSINNSSRQSVVTDLKGYYSLRAPAKATLVFKHMSYQQQNVQLNGRNALNIVMRAAPSALDEVVVIGYGTVRRADLTGAVGSVDMEDMANAPVESFDQALAGRVAGVVVTSSEDQPGSGMNIVIRGAGSLTQNTDPLYVIDGFPIEDFDSSTLNPDDIESINILKDASATAIYGARAANGVVLIQTKQGQVGRPTISYSGRVGISQANKNMELMSPYEFIKYELERSPSLATSVFFRDIYEKVPTEYATVDDLVRYKGIKGVDWQDLIMQNGSTNIHSLSLRGGTKTTRYSVSGSLYNQVGSIINSGSKRYQGKVALIQTVNSKMRAGIDINYSGRKTYGETVSTGANSVASSSLFYSVWGYRPVKGIGAADIEEWDIENEMYDDEVNNGLDYRLNPLISVQNNFKERHSTSFRANAWFTYTLAKDLTLKVQGGVDNVLSKSLVFYNSETHRGTSKRPNNTMGVNGAVAYSERVVLSNENTLNWKKIFNSNNRLYVLGGFSLQSIDGEGFGLASQNIPNEQLGIYGLNEGIPRPNSSRYSTSTMVSAFGRVNYTLNNKYLATVTYRADASSKFIEKWSYFPSAALAWRMSREPFMKQFKFISDAKLRTSYGLTGNNRVGDFSRLPVLAMPFDGSYSFNNGTPVLSIRQTNMGNKELKWETTAQADIGLDLGFLKNKFLLTVDVYRKTTRDLLLNANVPYVTGYTTAYMNIGKIRNDGLEITLESTNIKTKKFSWKSNFNISFNKNKLLALTADEDFRLSSVAWDSAWSGYPYIARVGGPAATFFGLVWDGVYNYEDFDIDPAGKHILKVGLPTNNPDIDVRPQPGDIKYRDINSDGIINDHDRVDIGRTLPIHTGGFSNTFQYKGIDLNVFFQWSYGNNILNANKAFFEGNQSSRNLLNQFASYEDRWTPENTSSTMFRVNGQGPNAFYSSRLIENGSYIRLKTVSLGYTIPAKYTKMVKLDKIRLSASVQNLFTLSGYSGMDPEVSVRNSVLTPGLDWSAYPRMRTFVFGASVTF